MAGSLLALQNRSGQSHALPSYWDTTLTNGSSWAVALFAGVGILQGTAHSERRVATALSYIQCGKGQSEGAA